MILAISASIAGKSSSERVRLGEVDVVIEAGGGGRAEGEPGAGEEPEDGPGHDVGGRVPQDVERLAVPRGEDPQLDRSCRRRLRAGRSRSTTVPSATAATAASASRLPIPSATSRGRTPSGYSLTDPSGSLIWTIVVVRRRRRPFERDRAGPPLRPTTPARDPPPIASRCIALRFPSLKPTPPPLPRPAGQR